MTTFNTGNPIGSTAVKDLYDNAENLDHATNDRSTRVWNDRFGVARRTWYGMEQDFQDFLIKSGYQDVGEYGPGLEITARNQIFRREIAPGQFELYRPGANLDLPYTTTGDWEDEGGQFFAVGDQVLRQQLADTTDPDNGAGMVGYRDRSAKFWLDATAFESPLQTMADKDVSDVLSGISSRDSLDDIKAAIERAKLSGLPVFISGHYRVSGIIEIDESHNGLSIRCDPLSSISFLNGFDSAEYDGKGLLTLKPSIDQTIKNLLIENPVLDGNKDNTVSPTLNSIHGIAIRPSGGTNPSYENVVIVNPVCRRFRGQGISYNVGGFRIDSPNCRENTWHGIGASSDGDFGINASISSPHCSNNSGYGFDFSRGRTDVTGDLVCTGNQQGGAKVSVGCEYVNVESARLVNNHSYGFRSTGIAPDLFLRFGSLYISGTTNDGTSTNPGQAFNLSTGKNIVIGSIIAEENNLYSPSIYDVAFSVDKFQADSIRVSGSKGRGGVVVNGCRSFAIGAATVDDSQESGFVVLNSKGKIGLLRLTNNNKSLSTDTSRSEIYVSGGSDVRVDVLSIPSDTREADAMNGVFVTGVSRVSIGRIDNAENWPANRILQSASVAGNTISVDENSPTFTCISRGVVSFVGTSATLYPIALFPELNPASSLDYEVQIIPTSESATKMWLSGFQNNGFNVNFSNAPNGLMVSFRYVIRARVLRK